MGRWGPGGHLSLFMIKWYSHVCWRTAWWPTPPPAAPHPQLLPNVASSLLLSSVVLSYTAERGIVSGTPNARRGSEGAVPSLHSALTSLQSCFCEGSVFLCWVGDEWTLKEGWLVGQSRPYCWKLTGTHLTHCSQQGVFLSSVIKRFANNHLSLPKGYLNFFLSQ